MSSDRDVYGSPVTADTRTLNSDALRTDSDRTDSNGASSSSSIAYGGLHSYRGVGFRLFTADIFVSQFKDTSFNKIHLGLVVVVVIPLLMLEANLLDEGLETPSGGEVKDVRGGAGGGELARDDGRAGG